MKLKLMYAVKMKVESECSIKKTSSINENISTKNLASCTHSKFRITKLNGDPAY